MAIRLFRPKFLLFFAALLVLLFLTRVWWLSALGNALVHDEGPGHADIGVVLAGDRYGRRILKAGELVRSGFVPQVLVSGPMGDYGHPESDYAIAYAVSKGYSPNGFVPIPHVAMSTRTEAEVMVAELRSRHVKSFLLITSDYHTARARRLYLGEERKTGGGLDMRVVAAPDEYFRPDSWWRDREGQKTAFMEWTKTVATAFGM